MIGNYISPLSGSRRILLATLATSTLAIAGCSNMSSTAPDANPFSSAAVLKGNVHGGNQPISGATVKLFYAGQKGTPGSPAALAATTTSASDGAGSFSFVLDPSGTPETGATNHFSCPTNNPLVYVMATGGNTINDGNSGTNNAAAAFLSIYGTCLSLSGANQVYMSEATTVATMAAISQFFDPATETITADGTGQQKIVIDGVPNTVALLASSTTGNAVTSTTLPSPAKSSSINANISVTATPEPGKVNLLANIIASCINNAAATAPQCTSLFSAAVPPIPNTTANNPKNNFPVATDTLRALYYMFTNPASISASSPGTANITTLYGLAGGAGAPYQPYPSTQPTDWTIAINYTSTGTCGTPTGGTGNFINSPSGIAIDLNNNVWFANSQSTLGNLSEISAAGVPTTCLLPGTGAAGGVTIDSLGVNKYNVWVGTTNGLVRYNPGTGASLTFATASTTPVALGADGVGDLYFTSVNGSTGSLYQLLGAATAAVASQSVATQISSTVGPNPITIMPDLKVNAVLNNVWVTSGSSFVSKVTAGSGAGSVGGFITTPFTTGTNASGLSISTGGNVYISDATTSAVTQLQLSSGVYTTPAGFPFPGTTAGVNGATAMVTDPQFNVWVPNFNNGTSTGSVSEFSRGPVAISPSTGFQKAPSYLNSSNSVVIDQAGNLWIAGSGNAFLTEIVGASVPVFQPYALGLQNGRFQQIP